MNAADVIGYVRDGFVVCEGCLDETEADEYQPVFAGNEDAHEMACEVCGDHLMEDDSRPQTVLAQAQTDEVGRHVAAAFAAAHKITGSNLDAHQEIVNWARRLRLKDSSPREFVVDCVIEVYADNHQIAMWEACRSLYEMLCRGDSVTFTSFCAEGVDSHLVSTHDYDNEDLSALFVNGNTVIAGGAMYHGLPEISVVDENGAFTHDPAHTHGSLNIKSLLETLDDEHIRPHMVWRTPEDELGRHVRAARGDRGEDD